MEDETSKIMRFSASTTYGVKMNRMKLQRNKIHIMQKGHTCATISAVQHGIDNSPQICKQFIIYSAKRSSNRPCTQGEPLSASDGYFFKNVKAARHNASTPVFIVGWITGANRAE